MVESTSGVLRETIDHVRVSELPLNGRNVLQLQVLIPGSVSSGSLDQGAGTPGYTVNGGIGASNMYSLDGGEYQDAYFNAPLPFPNPDAIQEFTIQTNSYSAEFGRNRGASINAITKSGSNAFHGGAFEFVRNDNFDARPFFHRRPGLQTQSIWRTIWRPNPQKQNVLLRSLAGDSRTRNPHHQQRHRPNERDAIRRFLAATAGESANRPFDQNAVPRKYHSKVAI
jgi:hypothetical protein